MQTNILPTNSLRYRCAGKYSHITPEVYQAVANELLAAIADRPYFSGTIEYDTEDFYSTLQCNLIVYHKQIDEPTYKAILVAEIVPTWWEFEIYDRSSGRIVTSNFSFKELKKYLTD